jgi:hypothetical protein
MTPLYRGQRGRLESVLCQTPGESTGRQDWANGHWSKEIFRHGEFAAGANGAQKSFP